MLIRTLFMLAMIAALAIAIVQATASLARADIHRRANVAADKAFATNLFYLGLQISNALAAGADPRALSLFTSTPAPTCVSTTATGACEFTATMSATSTMTQPIGTGPESSTGACTPLCATGMQENDAISEGRLAIHLVVTITGGSGNNGSGGTGAVFAKRDRYAIFRTLRIRPFAMLTGTRDATSDTITAGSTEGDDAGIPSLTTINVVYTNANTGASMPGNAWQSRAWNDANAGAANWEP